MSAHSSFISLTNAYVNLENRIIVLPKVASRTPQTPYSKSCLSDIKPGPIFLCRERPPSKGSEELMDILKVFGGKQRLSESILV